MLLCACKTEVAIENGIESYGNYKLQFIDSVTYELPVTFRPNSPFTKVFFDHATKKEYVTFGNDYATDSVYFFELTKGGSHKQATNILSNSKGIQVFSLDSIGVVTKKDPKLFLVNKNGEMFFSNNISTQIKISDLTYEGNNSFFLDANSGQLIIRANIGKWDYSESNRFINLKNYKKGLLNGFLFLKINSIYSDTISYKPLFSSFYKRFIDTNQNFFARPTFQKINSKLFCTSAYSDSLYWIDINDYNKIHSIIIYSHFFDTIKCTPAPLLDTADAYNMDFLSSRLLNNSLGAIHHLKNHNTYLINISRKAIELNESGNGSKFSEYGGLIVLDENLNKQAEFKLKNKYCAFTNDSLVFLGVIPDKTSPTYDPKKLQYEMYKMVPTNK